MRRLTFQTTLIVASLLAGSGTASAVEILLTNDDGYDAPGIVALHAALKAAGNHVTLVAPSGNRSGSSTALTFTPFTVAQIARDVYSVDSSPATTVLFGVSTVLAGKAKPDLIVSGINTGANTGPSTVISGTVGNVIAGITQLDQPIPGIAFSTNLVEAGAADSPANVRHFADVADFAARLIQRFTRSGEVKGLRPGLGLNVNYPALAPGRVKGVRFAVQGFALSFPPAFTMTAPGIWVSSSVPITPRRDVPRSDTILFNQGYVTIVPIDADYTADARVRDRLAPLLGGVTP